MPTPRTIRSALTAALLLGGAQSLLAQHSGDGYLFHAPEARLSIRGGYAQAAAGGDVFDFTVQQLTLKKSDFAGINVGAELGVPISNRLEGTLDVAFSRSSKLSEFRHFIDNNNLPIQQTTTFERVPITANLRYYLTNPGRSVGRLAWIPNKV